MAEKQNTQSTIRPQVGETWKHRRLKLHGTIVIARPNWIECELDEGPGFNRGNLTWKSDLAAFLERWIRSEDDHG